MTHLSLNFHNRTNRINSLPTHRIGAICHMVEIQGCFPGGASGKEPAFQCRRPKRRVRSLGQEDPLEEGMATHSMLEVLDLGRGCHKLEGRLTGLILVCLREGEPPAWGWSPTDFVAVKQAC